MKLESTIKKSTLALALLAALGSNAAFAATDLKVELESIPDAIGFSVFAASEGKTVSEYAGFLSVTNVLSGNTFKAFCTELLQGISPNAVAYELYSRPATPSMQQLFDTGYASLSTLDADYHNRAAGFQIALWEVLDDSNLNTGAFRDWAISTQGSNVLAYADAYLSGLAGPKTGNYTLARWTNENHQDVLIPSVPEPSMAIMFTLGLAGIGALARRRKS